MVNVILHGYSGRMGKMILDLVKDDPEICVAAGVDAFETKGYPFPVFSKMEDCTVKADVVIDFSVAAAVDDLLDWCVREKTACVLCTTGLDERQLARMKQASAQVAILKSANMSLGINLLMKLLKEAASVLAPAGFDIEIVEKHHKMKLDAPSGTALALGDSVREALDGEYENVFDRSRRRMRRPEKEIGYSAVRGGTIVGEHDVIFAGADEVVTFSHTAYSRGVFGKGAIQAAQFLKDQPAGLYDMSDVIG